MLCRQVLRRSKCYFFCRMLMVIMVFHEPSGPRIEDVKTLWSELFNSVTSLNLEGVSSAPSLSRITSSEEHIAGALLYLEKTISLTVEETSFIVAAVLSGAWLGLEAVRLALHWLDGRGLACLAVETEFWGAMDAPNLMVESSAADVADLVAALSLHVGEVARNAYHLRLPAWMIDNVRRGAELVGGQNGAAIRFRDSLSAAPLGKRSVSQRLRGWPSAVQPG